MDANVRAAAAETLRLCREAGHDVSPAVAALYVQAQRLAKTHPNELVARCAAKLAAAGDPALETQKMQMDVETTRALRAHAAAETRHARETRAGALEREVADTVVDAATVSGRAERLLLDRLHARAFEYVFVSAGLEPLLRDPPDSAARDDAHAAFESVFRRHAARRFFALPSAERAAALRELASVAVGALAFERRRGGGGDVAAPARARAKNVLYPRFAVTLSAATGTTPFLPNRWNTGKGTNPPPVTFSLSLIHI